ncbi:hypothetical protein Cni_G19549 [Canna indica]|uniref:Uncharacterized protein n=1 Tax=Canna indica TaxID=4628 RepID=A0AAQ3KMI5_9LILI|nr:hypothetical protein Cni_G19549 [Canna indica]
MLAEERPPYLQDRVHPQGPQRPPPRTVARFEDYRAAVKSRALPHLSVSASKRVRRHHHPSHCAAYGNELLRFHCTSVSCPLGAGGATSLCTSATNPCGVCTVIRHGFPRGQHPNGVGTTASSSRAHDNCEPLTAEDGSDGERRAMLVCRVITGRVHRAGSSISQ